MDIRSTAKAIIVREGKILLNKCRDERDGVEWYNLPGGGQNQFETLQEAVIRECLEETGYSVRVLRFAALCESMLEDPRMRENWPGHVHKIYHIFMCELEGTERQAPTELDSVQTGCEWILLEQAEGLEIVPALVGKSLDKIIAGTAPMFLGSERI